MASLKINFLYQIFYQILVVISPLITAPYVARVLGVDNSGIYSYTNTVASYFVILGMLGLEQYGNRCIAQVRDDKNELDRVFSELLFLHIIVSVISILLFFVYCLSFESKFRTIFFLQGFYVFSTLFDINWFFFGIEKFKLTVTRNAIIKILTVVATFVFVKSRDDLGVYTFILSFSILLSQLSIWPILRRYVSITRVPLPNILRHWKPLLILFIAVLAANLNRMIDKAMLGWFDRISDLGCYDYADKIVRIPLGFIAAIGTVMLSRMSNMFVTRNDDSTKKILDVSTCLVLIISFGMGFGVAAVAPEFVPLFLGSEYSETVHLLVILSASIPLVGWNNFVRTQILIPREMDKIYTRAVTIGAVVNILTNCFLIHFLGATGAAVATILSYAVMVILQTFPLIRELKHAFGYVFFPLIAGVVMFISVRLSSLISHRLFFSVCIEFVVGVIVFGGLSFVYLKKRHRNIINAIMK